MHVTLEHICKAYAGNPVLDEIDLALRPGEVHALVGENGAGKSTLMKILAGIEQPDRGRIVVDGEPRVWENPLAAREAGIAMVHQELALVPMFTVVENLFLGQLRRARGGFVDWPHMKARTRATLAELGFDLHPGKTVEALSIAEQQMVEIARAIAHQAELIILDEPTSALSEQDAERLFATLRRLVQKGVAVVYISHRLQEVFAIAHRISILRDGTLVRSCKADEVDAATVVQDMVGRTLREQFPQRTGAPGQREQPVVLEVEGATRKNEFEQVSFAVRRGEVVGFAGLVGAGRTELLEAVFGARKLDNGRIQINGRPVHIDSPKRAVQHGLGLIPDDRKTKGLVVDADVVFNLALAAQRKFATRVGWRQKRREVRAAEALVRELRIRLASLRQAVARLSGGNQQKVAIGKTLNADAQILIFDEPTRGIDVGAKREIYFLLRNLADRGAAIVLVSSELEELLGLCDRILVMHRGRITGELSAAEATQEKLMHLAVGMPPESENRTE